MMTETPSGQHPSPHLSERDILVKQCVDWRRARAVPGAFITEIRGKTPEQAEQIVLDDAQRIFGAALILKNAGVKNVLHWLRFLYRINDTLCIWGELPLHLAQLRSDFDHDAFELYEIDFDGKRIDADSGFENSKAWAVVCCMKRKGGRLQKTRWTLEDCYRAGHYQLSNTARGGPKATIEQYKDGQFFGGVWAKYPRRMMEQRAIQWAIKKFFPGTLDGLQMLEYDLDTMPGFSSPIMAQKQDAPAVLIAARRATPKIDP